jgi:hypothetical protein
VAEYDASLLGRGLLLEFLRMSFGARTPALRGGIGVAFTSLSTMLSCWVQRW